MKIGIRGKLFAISLLVIAAVGLTSGAFLESRLRRELADRIEADLLRRAETAQVAVSRQIVTDASRLPELTEELGRSAGVDVTVVDAEGAVLATSADVVAPDPAVPPPEVAEALSTGVGVARRSDGTSGVPVLYVATAFPEEGTPRGVVRLAMPLREVDAAIAELRALMLLAALVGLAAAVFMSGVASELLSRALRTLVDNAVALVRGERSESIPLLGRDELGRLAGSFNAITADLRQAVTDLAGERDRLQTILECMREAVLAIDKDGRLILANDAAHNLLALDDDDLERPLLEAVRVPALSELADAARRGRSASAEFEVAKSKRRVLAHAAPSKTTGGTVVVLHDVTDVRRLETIRRDFVANVSHELRTPIAVIRANAETLLGGALEDGGPFATRFVDAIYRNADRLSQLIADLLDLSRIEAGQLELAKENVDVEDAVAAVVSELSAKILDRNTTVEIDVEPELHVRADPTALGQIVVNFVDNAIKYAGKNVWIRAYTDEPDTVRVEVEDDGPGIERHHRERIFERFYRVDKGRSREVGGTGLGLSIVKHLAEAMGGRVGVDAAPERGSVFWIELPLGRPTLDAAEEAAEE